MDDLALRSKFHRDNMDCDESHLLNGYLDVKISVRARRRGFTPWRVWRKQWCELRHVGGAQHVVEFRVNSAKNGPSPSNFIIPRNAIVCRTESSSKKFAFGIFSQGSVRKPILFLSGPSESTSQLWMSRFRKMLSPTQYLPLRDGNFSVSLIDNDHSRKASIVGLFGTLSTGPHGIAISDPTTGHPKLILPWQHLQQFHLASTGLVEDAKRICVLHTNNDFIAGAGQLNVFCLTAPLLLQKLNNRGRVQRLFMSTTAQSPNYNENSSSSTSSSSSSSPHSTTSYNPKVDKGKFLGPLLLLSTRRLSRSDGDLNISSLLSNAEFRFDSDDKNDENLQDSGLSSSCSPADNNGMNDCEITLRHSSSSTNLYDDAVRLSINSDDSGYVLKSKTAAALITTGLGLLDFEKSEDIITPLISNPRTYQNFRRESGVSIASGIYEEILEEPNQKNDLTKVDNLNGAKFNKNLSPTHYYEDPIELILKERACCTPPPLPPRQFQDRFRSESYSDDALDELPSTPTSSFFSLRYRTAASSSLPYLPRCHTMPSQNRFHNAIDDIDDSDYIPMASPGFENVYLPMNSPSSSPRSNLRDGQIFFPATIECHDDNESHFYMDMNGKK